MMERLRRAETPAEKCAARMALVRAGRWRDALPFEVGDCVYITAHDFHDTDVEGTIVREVEHSGFNTYHAISSLGRHCHHEAEWTLLKPAGWEKFCG